MITIKQMETLYWIASLGTFDRAAHKLNTSQSAISKRIQELEKATGIQVFKRSVRGASLTAAGEHMLTIAKEMLNICDRAMELREQETAPFHRLNLGITELTAMTWLPKLVSELGVTYPRIRLEPEVEMSRRLYERLLGEDQIDIIVIPEAFSVPEVTAVPLAGVANVWMASPKLIGTRKLTSMLELEDFPLLTQGKLSGTGLVLNKWFHAQGVNFKESIACDSLLGLLGLAIAGKGVVCLPRDCCQPFIDTGKLQVIPLHTAMPPVQYVAMYRNDRPSAFTSAVASLARDVCDFSTIFPGA